MVLQYLDSHNVVGALLPALGHLAEGAAAEEFQHLILVVQRGVEYLVLDKLVVALGGGAPSRPTALSPAPRLAYEKPRLAFCGPRSSFHGRTASTLCLDPGTVEKGNIKLGSYA